MIAIALVGFSGRINHLHPVPHDPVPSLGLLPVVDANYRPLPSQSAVWTASCQRTQAPSGADAKLSQQGVQFECLEAVFVEIMRRSTQSNPIIGHSSEHRHASSSTTEIMLLRNGAHS